MNKIELLAPAGSLGALIAAVESGADAVYIGGSKFNARAYANNPDDELLKEAVEYAHVRGVKIYVAVNILILQGELKEAMEYIAFLYSINVDAVIVQDIGLATLIRRQLPDFEVHCSTQMAIHNTDGAALLSELGIQRVVLARELSLSEIDRIVENTGVDAEIFVHGALCVCYSGQCYMSSLIGGRSGNRGKCAQPCRKSYRLLDHDQEAVLTTKQGSYLLSTRDLNTYDNLYEIAGSKAASLKIEGRMKRPEYVAIIVHNYRQTLNCIEKGRNDCLSEQADYELRIAFNREFTQGYLFNKRNRGIVSTSRPDNRGVYIGKVLKQQGNMVELLLEDNYLFDGDSIEIIDMKGKSIGCTVSGIKKNNNTVKSAKAGDKIKIYMTDKAAAGSIVNKTIDSKLFQKAREEYAYRNKRKVSLWGEFTGRINEAPVLTIRDDKGNQITVIGSEIIQAAEKQAATKEKISEQLNKTKDTPYVFDKLDIDIEHNSFLTVKSINNLRRDAIEQLSSIRTEVKGRIARLPNISHLVERKIENKVSSSGNKEIIAGIKTIQAGISAIEADADTLYVIGDYRYESQLELLMELKQHCAHRNKKLYYILPQITRDKDAESIEAMLKKAISSNAEMGLVISNLSHIKMAERLKCKNVRGNFSLNIVNSPAADFYYTNGLQSLCVSPELNLGQIKELHRASDIPLEALVYGYLPAMITEYCPSSSDCNSSCHSCSRSYSIVDERNKQFRVLNMGNGKNTILNSDVLCIYDNLSNAADSGISKFRMDFYLEDEKQVFELVRAYKDKLSNLKTNESKEVIEELKKNGYTKGHYFRGID